MENSARSDFAVTFGALCIMSPSESRDLQYTTPGGKFGTSHGPPKQLRCPGGNWLQPSAITRPSFRSSKECRRPAAADVYQVPGVHSGISQRLSPLCPNANASPSLRNNIAWCPPVAIDVYIMPWGRDGIRLHSMGSAASPQETTWPSLRRSIVLSRLAATEMYLLPCGSLGRLRWLPNATAIPSLIRIVWKAPAAMAVTFELRLSLWATKLVFFWGLKRNPQLGENASFDVDFCLFGDELWSLVNPYNPTFKFTNKIK